MQFSSGSAYSSFENSFVSFFNRYFMLDFDTGILQYFVNEQSKNQKPRGVLSLAGSVVSLSDEAPNMLVVYSANGEMYKLKGKVIYSECFYSMHLKLAFDIIFAVSYRRVRFG